MTNSRLAGAACVLCYIATAVGYMVQTGPNIRHQMQTDRPHYRKIFAPFVENQQPQAAPKADSLLVVSDPAWCKPCRQLEPILDDLIQKGYKITKETPQEYRKRHDKQRITGIPTLLFMVGDKVVTTAVGFKDAKFIIERLKPL